MVPRGRAGDDNPLPEQVSALRSLLALSVLLTRQVDEAAQKKTSSMLGGMLPGMR